MPPPPRGASAPSNTGTSGGGTLPDGDYACYGSGGTVLAGLGFKVSGGRYTDLDGNDQGTVAIDGSDVVFIGGRISEIGRSHDFKGKSFRAGDMAVCEKWYAEQSRRRLRSPRSLAFKRKENQGLVERTIPS